jgi:phenylalanyl-tRNA synthetase beta chain
MRPISLAVDITNYVMLELGQPIHGYDGDKLSGPIVVRRAAEGERITTLDDVTRTLSAEDLLITDDTGPIGIAGVMGGQTTELSETTTDIVIEAAHFDAVSIFRTARRHKLPSEASKRFERGVDPTIPEAAADRVAELLVRFGGGTVEPGVTVVGAPPAARSIRLAADLPARITGVEIPTERAVVALEAVGCAVEKDGDDLVATAPTWRPDLTDPYDLVEEVIRVVGYDQVPSVLPPAPSGRGLTPAQQLRRRVGRTLAGAGYAEVVTFPFVGEGDFDALGLEADDPRRTALRLANPMRAEEPLMTTTLLPGLLRTLARNVGRGLGDVSLFETATVTLPEGSSAAPILPVDRRPTEGEWDDLNKALPRQPLHLGLALTGERERSGWWGEGRSAAWADAVQGIRDVAAALDVEVEVRAAQVAPWHPGRCAEILVGERTVGHAGELHPRVAKAFGLHGRTAVAEVDLDVLLEHAVLVTPAPEFSTFPVAKEDVALIVDADLPAETLAATLREGAGELCESVRLFDLYTGDQIDDGRKSLAFALRFRAPDRTLTEDDTAAARDAAVALARERHGAEHRV